jgi:hypothetical protein
MNPPSLSIIGMMAAIGLTPFGSLHAATTVIFADNFDSATVPTSTINEFGYYTRANSGNPWAIKTGSSATTHTGNYIETGGSTANGDTIKQWVGSPVSLNVGDTLTASFDVDNRSSVVLSPLSSLNLKMTFFDSSHTITANSIGATNPFNNKVSGYGYVQTNAGGSIQRYTNYDTTTALGGTPPAAAQFADFQQIYDLSVHTLTFSITRQLAGATFTFAEGGNIIYSYTDTTASAFTFNTLRLLAAGASGNGFYIDNIGVTLTTATIPEPATAAVLAGLGMLGLAATRRRRNN